MRSGTRCVSQPEIVGQVPPGLGAVDPCAAADAGGVCRVAALDRADHGFHAFRRDKDARVAGKVVRPGVEAVLGQSLVPQVVPANVCKRQGPPTLQKQHALSGFRQQRGGDSAPRARADDNRIVICHSVQTVSQTARE